jgi:phosphoribosylanthranilate isomerase
MLICMFHVKICGITTLHDARIAASAGADAVGLNFFPKSPRCISQEMAKEIVAALPQRVLRVGLFVNASAADICRVFDRLPLDFIQLHGDEPPEFLGQLGNRPVMRAFRVGGNPGDASSARLQPVFDYLDRCREKNVLPAAVLLDAFAKNVYGGSGALTDWTTAAEYAATTRDRKDRRGQPQPKNPPLVLAGGLTAANVAEAIRAVRPAAVDVASGVELSPGRKDPTAVAAFVRAALEAERALSV